MRGFAVFVFTLLLTGAATAQTGQSSGNPDVKNPQPSVQQSDQTKGHAGQAKLESGSNSFTEAQARSRLEEAGYQKLADLKKDGQRHLARQSRKGRAPSDDRPGFQRQHRNRVVNA